MIKRSLAEIANMTGGRLAASESAGLMIHGVTRDHRSMNAGNLFVPLIGERFDGHDFVQNAADKGASASLWQEDHPNPPAGVPLVLVQDTLTALQRLAGEYRRQLGLKVIGVTGSNGKTTTKDLTAAALSKAFRVHKTEGNYNNHIGLPLTLLLLEENTDIVVLEMGMSGRGEIELLSRLAAPNAAIITNIGEAHLLQLGSREEIARAKTEIVCGFGQDSVLIANGDEPLIDRVLPEWTGQVPHYRYVKFGTHSSNDVTASSIIMDSTASRFHTNIYPGTEFQIPVPGEHNVMNALAALAAAKHCGVSAEQAAAGISEAAMTSMRTEPLTTPQGVLLLNDAYNASPTSMKAAVKLLESIDIPGRRFAVLADMLELGPNEAAYHRELGQLLVPEHIDEIYLYGPLSKHTAEGALQNYPASRVNYYEDKDLLADTLSGRIAAGDAVLVKGSNGMKMETVVRRLMQLGGENGGF